jgi:hypothetical protein
MEITPLATRIHSRRQVRQEGRIKLPPGELRTQLGRINAREDRPVASPHKLVGQGRRVLTPQWEDPLPAQPAQQCFTIGAHVGEKEVTERDVP